MIYLSELLNKKVYLDRKVYGEMVDFAVLTGSTTPSVSKIVVKKKGKKTTISPTFLSIKRTGAILASDKVPFLPYDERDFYLNEDLLDKQVIDMDDKRVVRVNDILMESNGELKVVGIDVGASGILRRLGLSKIIRVEPKVLPWQMIEAFDYQTGNIKISLPENKLSKMHPAEIADILEELGTRERQGIMGQLEAERAAEAIEEVDFRTRGAILKELPKAVLKQVVAKMHIADIAGIVLRTNPLRIREILSLLSEDRAKKVERLLDFGEDTAGANMRTGFVSFDGNTTVKEAYNALYKDSPKPETILVTNGNEKFVGTINVKDILDIDSLAILKDVVDERKFVYPTSNFNQVISLFGRYNLRVLPVLDRETKKPIGIITAGIVLQKIEEKRKQNEFI